jgi:four helix bundle protein
MKEKSKRNSDLVVWQKSHILVIEVYRITKQFSKKEIFDLTSQLRRAATLIPANLAEGLKINLDHLPILLTTKF